MFNKLKTWRKKHKIEVFGILLLLSLICLVVNISSNVVYAKTIDNDVLTSQPYYNSDFISSISETRGEIKAVYTNADRTKVAILLHIPEITHMSSNASDYKIFYKGWNVSKSRYTSLNKNKPVGGYYIFGVTGYTMIYLVDSNGFQQQGAEVVLRCYKTLYEGKKDLATQLSNQYGETYKEYDQIRLIINPAANDIEVVDFLDDLDVQQIYQNYIIDQKEDAIRQQLINDVKTLNTLTTQIESYRESLEQLGVSLQDIPDMITNDKFVNCTDEHRCELSATTALADACGLIYIPGESFGGAVDFDWFHNTLHTADFLHPLLNGKLEMSFFNGLQQQRGSVKVDVNNQKVGLLDGSLVTIASLQSSYDKLDQGIATYLSNYTRAMNEYLACKERYQTQDLVSYLQLQYEMESSIQMFTSNVKDDTVEVW